MIFSLALNIIERVLNHFLQLDFETSRRLAKLTGKVVAIKSRYFNYQVFFIFSDNQIQLAARCERTADVTLCGSFFDFLRLSSQSDSAALFKNEIEVDGDLDVAEQFKILFAHLDIDWEEQLSHLTGDLIAHQIGNFLRAITDWARNSGVVLREDVTEYLQEEVRLLPTRIELENFYVDVDTVRNDVERVEKRIERLQQYV